MEENTNNKKRKICDTNISENKPDDLNDIYRKRSKAQKDKNKCIKTISNCNKKIKEYEKKIYALCPHNWIAEERQMYDKQWYYCNECGLYKNQYI